MNDRVVVGSLAGIIGSFASGILAVILNVVGITNIRMLFLDSVVFLPPQVADTIAGNIYGFLIHLLIGAIIGIAIMYILPYTGTDYLLYKGILFGAIAWLFIGGIIGNMLGLPVRDTLFDNTIFMILNIIFGIVTIYSTRLLEKTRT